MAPQLRQSLKILQVPTLDLRATILEELQTNPVLEELPGTEVSIEQLQSIFEDRYKGEPFVEVLPQGELPATRDVKASNNCTISVNYYADTDTIVVLAAIDNLVKGASGQAIQNMNIMFQLEETAGLEAIALLP